ncbi:hypothetical protein [Zooshikella harenae]|uniref:Uncharacterized protein n=1 Tax=Zooshikella harenae TaxID=2827238 RepID=A0ABS5ZG48_9GAMM|nr:hypothetical protein [Zooshikella harenae]MBU2713021.1 hypothetical protein [Zooshikella harenae]
MKKYIVALLTMLTVSNAYSIGHVSKAKVTQIRVDGNGRVMVYFNKPIEGTPATCVHNAYKNALGVDAGTEGGKAVLTKASGSLVTAYGLGVCGIYGGNTIETWNYGHIL